MKRICILLTLLFTFFNSYAVGSLNQNTSIVKVNQEAGDSLIHYYDLFNKFNRNKFDYINDNKLTFNFNKGFLSFKHRMEREDYGYDFFSGFSYNHKINDKLKISPIFEYEKMDVFSMEFGSLNVYNNISVGLGTKFNIDKNQELKNYLDYEFMFTDSGSWRSQTKIITHSFNLGTKYTYNLSLLKEKLNISPSIHHIIGYNHIKGESRMYKYYYISNELIPSLRVAYNFDKFNLYANLGLGIKIDNQIRENLFWGEDNVDKKNNFFVKFNTNIGIKGYINNRLSMDGNIGLNLKSMHRKEEIIKGKLFENSITSEEIIKQYLLVINPSINLLVKYDF